MHYFLGLDNGGTSTKAALFDERGTELGVVSVQTTALLPRPDVVERDMEEMWQANCSVIRGVLEKCQISSGDVSCVGICGHGKGLYLWGKDDAPARYGIISTDNRAFAYVDQWKKDGTEDAAFSHSCQHVLACQPVALLAWLKDHEPATYRNIRYVFSCKDYVRFRLTGEACAEYTDYSGNHLLNLHTGTYDEELLRLFGIPDIMDALPPLKSSLDICGTVSEEAAAQCGLMAGTPVIGGMFDIDACAIASGITDDSRICMIAGTWSINEYIRKEPVVDGSVLMNSYYCLPGYYLVEESSATSAGNNEWFVKRMLQGMSYGDVNALVESIDPDTFVPVFLPYTMSSNVHPNAKGSFVGISASHTAAHLARSVYEGIVFGHRQHLERLLMSRDTPPEAIRLAGGAANSRTWVQMFADILGFPVETVAATETGALGCAIACAAATGTYASIEESIRQMSVISDPVSPDPSKKELYDRKYKLYLQTVACLDPLWDDMQRLIDS